jgi:hypothetical protein
MYLPFLGTFVKLQKAAISFVLFARTEQLISN